MNQGMFGLPSGSVSSGRKLAGHVHPAGAYVTERSATVLAYSGVAYVATPLTAGVRTRIASVSGRGAVRAFATQCYVAGSTSRAEVWIDGKKAIDTGVMTTDNATSAGLSVVGFYGMAGYYPIAQPDYVPFDSSCELYLTQSVGGGVAAITGFRIDLHE